MTTTDSTQQSDDAEQVLSDATSRRILVAIGVVLAATALVAVTVPVVRAVTDSPEPYGPADIGFLQDMIDHHEQALLISRTYLENNAVGKAGPYAREVIMYQEFEITRMQHWLTDAGSARGAPNREAMVWMGMGSPVAEMPGMQTPERLAELAAARGAAADRLWFDMMTAHHLGGVHMAEAAAAMAERSDIRKFAAKMAYNQKVETVEYAKAVERLGL